MLQSNLLSASYCFRESLYAEHVLFFFVLHQSVTINKQNSFFGFPSYAYYLFQTLAY